jgi:chromosome partitioning protein
MSTCRNVHMPTIAIISQKGGAGKTTLALHLAAVAQQAGAVSLVIDTDPQATAGQWAAWRRDAPPEVIDSPPPRLAAKVAAAVGQGAGLIVIDTPPHADSAARAAAEVADLVLIPCRPSAFDLAAIQTSAKLVQLLRKPAFVVFTAGPPNAPRVYAEAGELVESYGTPPCPVPLPDRAAYRHASAEGRTVTETEPHGKAAEEVRELYRWTCRQLDMATPRFRRKP